MSGEHDTPEVTTSETTAWPSVEDLLNLEEEALESQALVTPEQSAMQFQDDSVARQAPRFTNEFRTPIRCEAQIASENRDSLLAELFSTHLGRVFKLVVLLPLTLAVLSASGQSPWIVLTAFGFMSIIAVFGFVFRPMEILSGNQKWTTLRLPMLTLDSATRKKSDAPPHLPTV